MSQTKVEKYRESIDRMVKMYNKTNNKNSATTMIEAMLNSDYINNKITEEEYHELIKYSQEILNCDKSIEKIEESLDNIDEFKDTNELDDNNKESENSNNSFSDRREKFKEQINDVKDKMNVDYIPIYKGEFNKSAPEVDREQGE